MYKADHRIWGSTGCFPFSYSFKKVLKNGKTTIHQQNETLGKEFKCSDSYFTENLKAKISLLTTAPQNMFIG